MQNVDKINFQVTDELVALRQRVAELEQSEIFYQQKQAALEEQVIELEKKTGACTRISPYSICRI